MEPLGLELAPIWNMEYTCHGQWFNYCTTPIPGLFCFVFYIETHTDACTHTNSSDFMLHIKYVGHFPNLYSSLWMTWVFSPLLFLHDSEAIKGKNQALGCRMRLGKGSPRLWALARTIAWAEGDSPLFSLGIPRCCGEGSELEVSLLPAGCVLLVGAGDSGSSFVSKPLSG